jgi:hypothetical protein
MGEKYNLLLSLIHLIHNLNAVKNLLLNILFD